MCIGEILRTKQPEVYRQLMFQYPPEDQDEEDRESFREAKKLMSRDAYRRDCGGAIRQIRFGDHE